MTNLFRLCIAILMIMLAPVASAAFGEVRDWETSSGTQTNRQHNVPTDMALSIVMTRVSAAGCVATCQLDVIVLNDCTSPSFTIATVGASSQPTQLTTVPLTFTVKGGDCYFLNTSGSIAVLPLNYLNVTYALFESQAHANETWESQAHANATWESQPYANESRSAIYDYTNATFCLNPCAAGEGDFVGSHWFNTSWVPAPTFGSITASQITVGVANTTELEVQGNVTLTTQIDPYLPLLIFGGLALYFFYYVAWLPAIICLANMGNHFLPTPIWGLAGSSMLLAIGLVIHVAVTRSIIPAPWGRKATNNKEG